MELPDVDKADAYFKMLLKNLPHNTKSVYMMIQLTDCELYIPSRFQPESKELEREKRVFNALVKYIKY